MLLRQRMYVETQKYRKLRLGGFKFTCTKAVSEASNRVYALLLESRGNPDLSKFGPLFHTLARELLVYSSKSHKIGGPSDFILMLQSLKPDGQFDNNANTATRSCSQMQYILRSIFIHCRRLKGSEYTPVVSSWDDVAKDVESEEVAEVGTEETLIGRADGNVPSALESDAERSNVGMDMMPDDDPISLDASIDINNVTKSIGEAFAFMDNDDGDDDIVE
jgi:hypothetical protein